MCNNLKFSRHEGKVCPVLYAKNSILSRTYMNRICKNNSNL